MNRNDIPLNFFTSLKSAIDTIVPKVQKITSAFKQINALGNALQGIKNLSTDESLRIHELEKIGKLTKNLSDQNLKLLLSQKQLNEADSITILQQHNLNKTEATAKLEKLGLIAASQAQTAANTAEAASTSLLSRTWNTLKTSAIGAWASIKAMIASNPIGFALKAISTVTSAISFLVSKSKQASEEVRQAMENALSRFQSAAATIQSHKIRFLELSKGVDEFSHSLTLSESEYSEYLSICNELAKAFPSLVYGYDEQGNALLLIGKNAEETTKKLNELLAAEEAVANQALIDNMGTAAADTYNQIKEAQNKISSLQSQRKNYEASAFTEFPKELIQDVDEFTKVLHYGSMLDMPHELKEQLIQNIIDSGAAVDNYKIGDSLIFYAKDQALVKQAIKDFYDTMDNTKRIQNKAYIQSLERDIKEQEAVIKNSYAQMNKYLSAWLGDSHEYEYLSNAQQKLIDSLLPTLDWDSISKKTGKIFPSDKSYIEYIKDTLLHPLMNISKEQKEIIDVKLSELFLFSPENSNRKKLINELQAYFNEIALDINLKPLAVPSFQNESNDTASRYSVILAQKDNIKSLSKEMEYLEDIWDKSKNGHAFDKASILELVNTYPTLKEALIAAADGYSLEESAVKSLLEQKTTSYNESVALSMRETEQEIENIKARIKARNSLYQTKPDMPFGTIAQRYAANAAENEADEKKLWELTEYLEGLNFLGAKEAAADKTSIDWLSNSVQNLLEKADALRTSFSNTKGIKAQKAALSDLNKEAAKLRDSYYSPTDNSGTVYGEYQKRYQKALNSLSMDSSLVRSKIETGDIFHMEEFSSADAELINNAIDAWNSMRDAKKKYLELNTELSDNALKALELDAEHLSSLKALTQSRLDTPASDSEQLKLYKELEDCISEYYKTQTAIAKLKQDTAAISSLELERQKELADIEQKRLELVRAQAEAELSQISRSQNQILGTIEYNDGNASAADYNALLQLGAKELEARNKEYERELALLFELETSLGQNSSEYREQQSRVNGIADAIDKCQKNTKDWTKSLLALPVRQIEQAVNGLNQKLEETQNDIDRTDTIIAGAQAYIQKEIDGQEKLKDAVQNQLTSLQKANDERSRTLALQKAQYELERAYSQRTVKVYREGEGFVYEQSLDDIRNAKESYDNANYEKAVASLEKQLEYYDGIISDLEQVKEKWGSIAGDAKDFLNIQQTLSAIGTNGIFSDNVIEGYAKIYTGMLRSKESTEAAIKHLEDFKESIEDVTEQYGLGVATYEECMAAIGQLVSSFYGKAGEEGASALEKIKAIVDQITEQFQLADGSAQINAAAETSAELTKKLQAETQTQADIMQNFADEVSNTFHLVCEASIADASAAFQSLGESIVQTAALIQEQLNSMIGNAGSSLNTLKSIAKEAEKISSSSTQNPGGVNPDTSMPPLGNEHITVLPSKEGEGLLQFSGNGSWDNPQTGSFGITPVKLPEFQPVRFAEASIQSSTPVPVVQNISVTLPNVTNESGYNKFVQTIEHLPLDTIQYINKA